ncbi:MAG: hypothetical protein AAGF04_03740 [Chlamydiota bacterium]
MRKKQVFFWIFCLSALATFFAIACIHVRVLPPLICAENIWDVEVSRKVEKDPSFQETLFYQRVVAKKAPYPSFQSKLVARYTPPKPGKGQGHVFLGIRGEEPLSLSSTKPLYLAYEPYSSGEMPKLYFAEKSDFSLEPVRCEPGLLVLQPRWKPKRLSFDPAEERLWTLRFEPLPETALLQAEPCFAYLAKAQYLGEDLFVEKAYSQKVYWVRTSLGTCLPLRVGDCCVHDGSVWKANSFADEELDQPLFRVQKADDTTLVCEAWNCSGEKYALISLKRQASIPCTFSGNSLEIHSLKTPKTLAFSLENSPLLMRPGQWAAKIGGSWQRVESEAELQRLLTECPTFFFEKLCKREGKKWFCGKLYSPFRIACLPVEEEWIYVKNGPPSHLSTKSKTRSPP